MISINEIDKGNAFDWRRVSSDYAKYRDIYPVEFYNKIIKHIMLLNPIKLCKIYDMMKNAIAARTRAEQTLHHYTIDNKAVSGFKIY